MERQISLFNESSFSVNCEVNDKYYKSLKPIKVTPVYDTFWKFAHERQEIYIRRYNRKKYPWTDDKILNDYKFTNVYRASDRVSQYLIKNVIYNNEYDDRDTFFRILLFKIFNKIQTWELLEKNCGELIYSNYNFKKYDAVLSESMRKKESIYSAAYIMPSKKLDPTLVRKHSNHLRLIERMVNDSAYIKIAKANSLEEVFRILISYPLMGEFLSFQYAIDLNYSQMINFSENDFVVPGPGALNGIKKCFISTGEYSPGEIIKFMTDRQSFEFERLGLGFKSLWGRPLKLIDIQNIFCEVDKYSRVAHPDIKGVNNRKRIKQKYVFNNKEELPYYFPPKWKLNGT